MTTCRDPTGGRVFLATYAATFAEVTNAVGSDAVLNSVSLTGISGLVEACSYSTAGALAVQAGGGLWLRGPGQGAFAQLPSVFAPGAGREWSWIGNRLAECTGAGAVRLFQAPGTDESFVDATLPSGGCSLLASSRDDGVYARSSGTLLRINPTTGAATEIGSEPESRSLVHLLREKPTGSDRFDGFGAYRKAQAHAGGALLAVISATWTMALDRQGWLLQDEGALEFLDASLTARRWPPVSVPLGPLGTAFVTSEGGLVVDGAAADPCTGAVGAQASQGQVVAACGGASYFQVGGVLERRVGAAVSRVPLGVLDWWCDSAGTIFFALSSGALAEWPLAEPTPMELVRSMEPQFIVGADADRLYWANRVGLYAVRRSSGELEWLAPVEPGVFGARPATIGADGSAACVKAGTGLQCASTLPEVSAGVVIQGNARLFIVGRHVWDAFSATLVPLSSFGL
ncbi:MAG: hypothetical protein HY904_22985 [Deltaproteobacteria bacterium]|nr:hypothetical protein [Deltaproteobacteria bacterium]